MITHQHWKSFLAICRIFDGIPEHSNYIDERLLHRVQNLCLGWSMLGSLPIKSSSKSGAVTTYSGAGFRWKEGE